MIIRINNLRLKTLLGIYEWEQKCSREIIINIELKTKNNQSVVSDRIEDTIDYDFIIKDIKDIVGSHKFGLIERLSGEIISSIMKDKRIMRCKLEIAKMGIVPDVESCSVIIEEDRADE